MKTLLRWWLRFEYGFNMAAAYLASHTGEWDVMNAHKNAAYAVEGRLDRLEIQP